MSARHELGVGRAGWPSFLRQSHIASATQRDLCSACSERLRTYMAVWGVAFNWHSPPRREHASEGADYSRTTMRWHEQLTVKHVKLQPHGVGSVESGIQRAHQQSGQAPILRRLAIKMARHLDFTPAMSNTDRDFAGRKNRPDRPQPEHRRHEVSRRAPHRATRAYSLEQRASVAGLCAVERCVIPTE